jgi:hypothetical protein
MLDALLVIHRIASRALSAEERVGQRELATTANVAKPRTNLTGLAVFPSRARRKPVTI